MSEYLVKVKFATDELRKNRPDTLQLLRQFALAKNFPVI